MKSNQAELIRALTPCFLAGIGGAIGLAVIFSPGLNETRSTAGLGLAGTAIAGAAGLAQPNRNFSSEEEQKSENLMKVQE